MAGWLIALAYLVCIVSPGVALAFGSGPAPRLTDEMSAVAFLPAPDESAPMMSMHAHESSQDHGSTHDHGGPHAHHHHADAQAGSTDKPAGHHHKGNALPGPCCAMMCVSAIPADLPALSAPSLPFSICAMEAHQSAPGKAPPLLYRPPIA
jgi:hypothetical protein